MKSFTLLSALGSVIHRKGRNLGYLGCFRRGLSAQRIFSFLFVWFAPMLWFPLGGARNHHFPRRKEAGNWHERIDIIEQYEWSNEGN
jgi:hypothetical protein